MRKAARKMSKDPVTGNLESYSYKLFKYHLILLSRYWLLDPLFPKYRDTYRILVANRVIQYDSYSMNIIKRLQIAVNIKIYATKMIKLGIWSCVQTCVAKWIIKIISPVLLSMKNHCNNYKRTVHYKLLKFWLFRLT